VRSAGGSGRSRLHRLRPSWRRSRACADAPGRSLGLPSTWRANAVSYSSASRSRPPGGEGQGVNPPVAHPHRSAFSLPQKRWVMNERACKHCGRLTWSSRSPYCLEHRPPPEVRATWATKTRAARGYGSAHKAMRERYRALIESGSVVLCARCRRRILPSDAWDLGHVDGDKNRYAGPEHRACNRATSGRRVRRFSRRW
jgi:hypothetical protein